MDSFCKTDAPLSIYAIPTWVFGPRREVNIGPFNVFSFYSEEQAHL